MLDLADFADPWEHARLLSDRSRNDALIELLRRRAPGATVLEVGCGTGLLSCVAARLGARRVFAVEPTPMWRTARRLVQANGLDAVVTVLPGAVQDLDPTDVGPVDLAFSELLNADPLAEGILEAMDAAGRLLAPGGRLAPHRLQVQVGLAHVPEPHQELSQAVSEVRRLGADHGLDVKPLTRMLRKASPNRYLAPTVELWSPLVTAIDIPLGVGFTPEDEVVVQVIPDRTGRVTGATIAFHAELDAGLTMHNRPGCPGHWGHLVCGWTQPIQVTAGVPVRLRVVVEDDSVEVTPDLG
jgi:protein-L-isoaspartate O-methyltransferase